MAHPVKEIAESFAGNPVAGARGRQLATVRQLLGAAVAWPEFERRHHEADQRKLQCRPFVSRKAGRGLSDAKSAPTSGVPLSAAIQASGAAPEAGARPLIHPQSR